MDRWREKVAVVTGASEGIGEAIVRRLAKEGMKVAALARRIELLDALERDVNSSGVSGSVKGYKCDVGSENEVTEVFKSIETDLGPVSILVNNAGVFKFVNPTEINIDDSRTMIDTNLIGVLNCIKCYTASVKAHSTSDGHIVNISSIAGHRILPAPGIGVYSATKHALNVISTTLRNQLKKEKLNIRVTTMSPGVVKTSMSSMFVDKLSLGHYILPENIADAVVYVIGSPSHMSVSEITVEEVAEFPYPQPS